MAWSPCGVRAFGHRRNSCLISSTRTCQPYKFRDSRFVQLPEMFGSSEEFDTWFGNKLAASGAAPVDDAPASSVLHAEQVLIVTNRLHQVLRPFLLRRTKAVLAAELPSKTEHAIACPTSAYQDAMLRLLREKGREAQAGSVTGVNNVVMEMRKVCCRIVSGFTLILMSHECNFAEHVDSFL